MATKGQTISNRVTGETITWLATSKDTGGAYLELMLQVDPKGLAAVNHIHPNQDEYFKIKKGTISIQIGKDIQILGPGQQIMVPKGTPHQWWNPSSTENLEMELTFTPAQQTEVFFEQFFGLCNDGKNNPDGSFRFMQAMASLTFFDIFVSNIPIGIQKFLSRILGPVARQLGYKTVYPEYASGKKSVMWAAA